ncbi:hypothetical protein V6Z11_A13G034400 [Gossypium hirsutum]
MVKRHEKKKEGERGRSDFRQQGRSPDPSPAPATIHGGQEGQLSGTAELVAGAQEVSGGRWLLKCSGGG